MNKKGFTLVELLAVIVVLGLLLVITMTNGFGIFNKAKSGINQIEENNLIEAAKVFLVDVDNDFLKSNEYPTGCVRNDFLNPNTCNVSVSYILNKYMDKTPEGCDPNKSLTLSIEYVYDSNGNLKDTNYNVNKSEIICTK